MYLSSDEYRTSTLQRQLILCVWTIMAY